MLSSFSSLSFMRSIAIEEIHNKIYKYYGISPTSLGIPEGVFDNSMTLIPCSEVAKWFETIEQLSNDADFMLILSKYVRLERLGSLGEWFLSAHDLALTFRRFNYGMSCLQSGAHFYGVQQGKYVKWTYDSDSFFGRARFHDAIRVSLLMMNILRKYLGEQYTPLKIRLPYSTKQPRRYEEMFGCPVEWNSPRTEIWVNTRTLADHNCIGSSPVQNRSMKFADLDSYLNMPQPNDHIKIIYELINYSRYFGVPTLARVANFLDLSEQQLQRRLTPLGFTFTNITGYVLCNIAAQMMLTEKDLELIANQLGYKHKASFVRTNKYSYRRSYHYTC